MFSGSSPADDMSLADRCSVAGVSAEVAASAEIGVSVVVAVSVAAEMHVVGGEAEDLAVADEAGRYPAGSSGAMVDSFANRWIDLVGRKAAIRELGDSTFRSLGVWYLNRAALSAGYQTRPISCPRWLKWWWDSHRHGAGRNEMQESCRE